MHHTELELQDQPRRARVNTVAHAEGNPHIPVVAIGTQRRRVSKLDCVYWGSNRARDHKLENSAGQRSPSVRWAARA